MIKAQRKKIQTSADDFNSSGFSQRDSFDIEL
jgi:hypothetical protein